MSFKNCLSTKITTLLRFGKTLLKCRIMDTGKIRENGKIFMNKMKSIKQYSILISIELPEMNEMVN